MGGGRERETEPASERAREREISVGKSKRGGGSGGREGERMYEQWENYLTVPDPLTPKVCRARIRIP